MTTERTRIKWPYRISIPEDVLFPPGGLKMPFLDDAGNPIRLSPCAVRGRHEARELELLRKKIGKRPKLTFTDMGPQMVQTAPGRFRREYVTHVTLAEQHWTIEDHLREMRRWVGQYD